jgi:hypothetical protein
LIAPCELTLLLITIPDVALAQISLFRSTPLGLARADAARTDGVPRQHKLGTVRPHCPFGCERALEVR